VKGNRMDSLRILGIGILVMLATILIDGGVKVLEQKQVPKYVVTRECVYQNGCVITQDGSKFLVDYNIKNGSLISVKFKTNGTKYVTDDHPIEYKIIKED